MRREALSSSTSHSDNELYEANSEETRSEDSNDLDSYDQDSVCRTLNAAVEATEIAGSRMIEQCAKLETERVNIGARYEEVREFERHRFEQWRQQTTQQHLVEIERLQKQHVVEIERMQETFRISLTSGTESSISASDASESEVYSSSSSSRSSTIPNELNSGTVGTVTNSGIENTASRGKSKRQRRKQRAHSTILRKLDEALERCRLLEARQLAVPLESTTRIAVNTKPTIQGDGVNLAIPRDTPAKTDPIVVWIRVDRRRRGKWKVKKQHSPSAGGTVITNQTTSHQSKRKKSKKSRKKTPNIETVLNPEVQASLNAAQVSSKSKNAERRRRARRAKRDRKKAESPSSEAPAESPSSEAPAELPSSGAPTLRRHRRRKQRVPPSPVVPPANPQSRQEDSLAGQQSDEGADTIVSAPGRS